MTRRAVTKADVQALLDLTLSLMPEHRRSIIESEMEERTKNPNWSIEDLLTVIAEELDGGLSWGWWEP